MFAASSSKARRAVAAAWRICTPPFWIERLPYVGPWSGVSAVSPSMMLTEGNGTSSVFGDDLTQRGSYACSKVNLTGFHRNHPARVDGEEGIDFSGCHGFHERSCLTKRLRQFREEKPTISTPLALRTSWRDGRVHLTPHQTALAARWTARTMRTCVPQRQRLLASAILISASARAPSEFSGPPGTPTRSAILLRLAGDRAGAQASPWGIPVRPLLFGVDRGDAGPAKPFPADPIPIAHSLSAPLHGIKEMVGRIDHDRAPGLPCVIGDNYAPISWIFPSTTLAHS